MEPDRYWKFANAPQSAEQAARTQAQHFAEAQARMIAMERARIAEQERKEQERKEREEFMLQVELNRQQVTEAMAAGLTPVINAPALNNVFSETKVQHDAELKERIQNIRSSEHAWHGQGLLPPPHAQKARKAQYFAELNAEMGYPEGE